MRWPKQRIRGGKRDMQRKRQDTTQARSPYFHHLLFMFKSRCERIKSKNEREWISWFVYPNVKNRTCFSGAKGKRFHLRVGIWQRRKTHGLVQLRRIHKQHLHFVHQFCNSGRLQTVVSGRMFVDIGHHLQFWHAWTRQKRCYCGHGRETASWPHLHSRTHRYSWFS